MTIAVDLGRNATKPTNQPKWPRPRGLILHRLRENMEKLTCLKPQGLDVWYVDHLVDLYQVCSNYAYRAKNGPALGVT